jgi:hypothetical protein
MIRTPLKPEVANDDTLTYTPGERVNRAVSDAIIRTWAN